MVELTNEQIRSCMEEVVDVMRNSVAEVRKDGKPTPKVGALIVKPDGTKETAFRGELREGDHAEYTLIERKCRDQNLTGAILFATLEPCAPGARKSPKLSCAERITNARIAKVFYGIEDPDPTVSGKGCAHLKEYGVEVAYLIGIFRKKSGNVIRNSLMRQTKGVCWQRMSLKRRKRQKAHLMHLSKIAPLNRLMRNLFKSFWIKQDGM